MRSWFSRSAVVLLAGTLLATGCGSDGDGDAATAPTTASSGQRATASARFPVTVESEHGEVTIEEKPARIVSLSPSLTEMLFAVGAGDQVTAVDRYSNFPQGTPVTDLSGFRPNIEAIAGYAPDLVVLASDREGAVGALEAAGIPVLVLSSADRLRDVYREVEVLGAATGHPAKAHDVVDGIRADLEEVAGSVPERERPIRYFYELSSSLHSATSETFIGELLGLIGLRSIADGADDAAGGFPQLSNEYVVDADPELIFLAHTDGSTEEPAAVAARPGWDQISAVQDDRIVALDPDVSSRWGPRVVALLRSAAEATDGLRA